MNPLRRWMAGEGERLRWLDLERYAWAVFDGGTPAWLDAARRAGILAQGQSLLGSDVVQLDLTTTVAIGAEPTDEDAVALLGERLRQSAFVAAAIQVVDAVAARVSRRAALVLAVDSPQALLQGAGAALPVDGLDADDVAVELAGLLRHLADRPVDGIVIGSHPQDDPTAWHPLLTTARHYGWVIAAAPAVIPADLAGLVATVDLLLPPTHIPDLDPRVCAMPIRDWTGATAPEAPFVHSRIPVDAVPEKVLDTVASWR